jgi:hypothetical protein
VVGPDPRITLPQVSEPSAVVEAELAPTGAPAYNNAVGASARYARSGVHGAYGVRARERVGRGWAGHGSSAFVLAPRRQPLNVICHLEDKCGWVQVKSYSQPFEAPVTLAAFMVVRSSIG